MSHLDATLKELGFDDPSTAVGGRRFEHFVQQVFRKHPGEFGRERFRDVWLWDEWPDRESCGYSTDCGIDLVARQTWAYGGGLCAIQCKYRSAGSVSKREVDSFLAAVGSPFSSSLIVSTSDIAKNGVEKIQRASPQCQILYSAEMDDWVDDWRLYVESPESFEIPPPRKYELFDFQRDALEAVSGGLSRGGRGKLILPCGTGKSFVALRIAERLAGEGGRVLYLVPSIALVGQTMREWSAQRALRLEYLGVCSDATAGRKSSRRVDLAGNLAELAIPVTTDPGKIRERLEAPLSPGVMQVVFSTYNSSPRVQEAVEVGDAIFDLIICDEAHRTTGIESSAGEASYYRIVHSDDCIPAFRRLYMTATPRVFTEGLKRKLAVNEDPDCYDMNDESVYGNELYRMSFGEAVKAGHLSEYEILVIAAGADSYLQSIGNSHDLIVGSDKAVSLDDAVKLAGCWDALSSPETTEVSPGKSPGQIAPDGGAPARSAIAFTNRVDTSKWVAGNWRKVVDAISADNQQSNGRQRSDSFLRLDVGHVDGSTPASERVKYLRKLEQRDSAQSNGDQVCQIVSNARVLSEGVNVPSLDAVLFLDPRSSPIDITQQVGRVMRRAPGKEKGYIVIPVVVPELSDPKEVLEASSWDVVWRVVKALRSHDERLSYYVNNASAWEKNAPMQFRVSRLGQTEDDTGEFHRAQMIQLELALNKQIASMVVDICGDRNVYPTWGKRAADVCQQIQKRIEYLTGLGGKCEPAFKEFLEGLKGSVRRDVTVGEAQQMIAQHIVTIPIFDAMLGKNEFSQQNPVSKDVERLLRYFNSQGVYFDGDTRHLTRAYEGMREAFEGAVSSSERIDILRRTYEEFFKLAMKDTVKRMGIVYTPVEIVDFIIRSVTAICKQEFKKNISQENVNVLDAFAGTGTFLARLLEMRDDDGEYIIRDQDLDRKYQEELHANETVLLAYYIAALRIEEAKHSRDEERFQGLVEYVPFDKILLTDTFHGLPSDMQLPGFLDDNIKNRLAQDMSWIEIIIGNPPWSSGQKSAGDDNPNIEYDEISQRIKDTYGVKHKEITGKAAGGNASGNLYLKALRWATDRILPCEGRGDHPAVISIVHPNSLTDATSLAGVRATLREEFSDIYIVNLRGNAYKSGEEFKKEGDKIFGGGSRNGVQITFLVRYPDENLSKPATLHYVQVPDYMNLKQKFEWLKKLGDITSPIFDKVPIASKHDWVNLSDGSYNKLLTVCGNAKLNDSVAVNLHASGVKTNSDVYVYSFSRVELERKMRVLIDAYNAALYDIGDSPSSADFEDATENDRLHAIKWTGTLKSSLKQQKKIEFEPWRIREVLYRPFTKLWLYEDDRILSSVKTVSKMFPRDESADGSRGENRVSADAGDPESEISGGGGAFLSQRPRTRPSSGFSPRDASGTFARSERSRPVERLRDSDPSDGAVEHGDIWGAVDQPNSRSAFDGVRSADESDPEEEITRGGGGLQATILIMRDTQLPFAAFATRCLPDLHVTGRPTRNLPKTLPTRTRRS